MLPQSQQIGRWSGNMSSFSKNSCVILKFIEQPKTSGITFKNMAFSERNQLSAGNFHAVLDELNSNILQCTKK